MAVIVHDGLIADTLDIQPGPGRAEGAEAHGDAKDPVDVRPDRHELGEYVVGRQPWRSRRSSDLGRAAAQARDCKTAQEITSIHQLPRRTGLENPSPDQRCTDTSVGNNITDNMARIGNRTMHVDVAWRNENLESAFSEMNPA